VLIGTRNEAFIFDIGIMPPATEPRGIQMRLWNLGYYSGKFSDVFTPETEGALRRFLSKNGLTADDEDQLKLGLAFLVTAHGS
jgi:peptidoglycan hydrolase-like protein with peptidoglycan-binding domain